MPAAHEAASLFPMMSDAEISDLATDIQRHGLRNPIVMLKGKILDGRNRYAACVIGGVEPVTVEYEGTDPIGFASSANLKRRHLEPHQRAAIAAEMVELYAKEARERSKANLKQGPERGKPSRSGKPKKEADRSVAKAAKAAGAGVKATQSMLAVKREAPEVFEAVKDGRVSTIADAARLATLAPEQREIAMNHVDVGASVAEAISHSSQIEHAAQEVETALKSFETSARALDRAADRLEGVLQKHGVSLQGVRVQQVRAAILLAGQRIDDLIARMDGKQ